MMSPSSCVTNCHDTSVTGDGLPDMATQDEVLKALESVGFEVQGPQTVMTSSSIWPRLLLDCIYHSFQRQTLLIMIYFRN